MAGIQERANKNGDPRWQVAVRIKGRDPMFATHDTKADAQEYGKDLEKKIRREMEALRDPHSWLPESGDMMDERFLDTLGYFEKTRHEGSWHLSTIPSLRKVVGDPTIGQITKPSWIKKYIKRARKLMTERSAPYAWNSIRHQLCVVSKAIQWRADELDISPPPFVVRAAYYVEAAADEGLRKDALNNERDRRFEPGEEEALMSFLRGLDNRQAKHWPLLIQLAIETGARLQELILAEWGEINPTDEWWDIPGKHSKTYDRTMMLTDGAVDALAGLRLLSDPKSPRIFHTMKNPNAVSSCFAKYRAKAGLKNFTFHDLRHEGISRFVLTQIDYSPKAIMEMVGHSSIEMLNRYAKLRPNELVSRMRRRPKEA